MNTSKPAYCERSCPTIMEHRGKRSPLLERAKQIADLLALKDNRADLQEYLESQFHILQESDQYREELSNRDLTDSEREEIMEMIRRDFLRDCDLLGIELADINERLSAIDEVISTTIENCQGPITATLQSRLPDRITRVTVCDSPSFRLDFGKSVEQAHVSRRKA